ncbi:SAM-dependent methyltransferase [Rhodobacteraceae bacterium N5(2021)]|uniref:SAM-dependent methyltransferase n=2 Tax=Gymnodinialimonas phycosphaerae TaxID=2841589 RepID=A0A975TUJ3_9RHOB|nr:methyltransferase domain-containing protein [Gymnodinialimonas phycosphaerae]MBY4894350.1 SAM-dependent methyltransferase [Gymnodinialimonas phycosphaerae]
MPQPRLTDATALAAHRTRAMPRIADARFLHDEAMAELQERLEDINRTFTRTLIVTDFPKIWCDFLPDAQIVPMTETLDLEVGAYDLVVHAMGLHWADDPVGQVVQCARALQPDGLFLSAAFGGSTLTELRQALAQAETQVMGGLSPRVAPMAEVRDMGALLQRAGLALPVADTLRKTVTYSDAIALMKDLRAMGETNALAGRHKAIAPRAFFPTAAAIYANSFPAEENRIQASFEFVFLTGWAPHDSQQQPLRPGAATSRLATALNVTEHSASAPLGATFDEGTNPVHDLPKDGSSNQK